MRAKITLGLVLGALLVFGFYGEAAAGGGGPEDPGGCTGDLPPARRGTILRGEFITAGSFYDVLSEGDLIPVAITVRKGNDTRLFSFIASFDNACEVTPAELLERFKWIPCRLGVAGAFDLSGIPIITKLNIVDRDQCGSVGAMISGDLVLRVVPVK